jgi:hypothetical protein
MSKSWATFEELVRHIAANIWGKECAPAHIGGVDIDGRIVVAPDLQIFIEITERRELAKIREDIIKLQTAKAALLQTESVFARCFCVVNGSVTQAMQEAGAPHKISVLSFKNFSKMFYDFESYRTLREKAAFGSAVNPLTGKKDDSVYVPVTYLVDDVTEELSSVQIAKLLQNNKRIVLLGEYGSGKSRCLREIFKIMAPTARDEHTGTKARAGIDSSSSRRPWRRKLTEFSDTCSE